MKNIRNKIIVFAMTIILALGTVNTLITDGVYADEFDGDITENPWSDLLKDDTTPDGITINNQEKQTTSSSATTSNNVSVSKIRKKLTTSIKSATKKTKKAKKARIILKKVKNIKSLKYQIKYATNKSLKHAKIKTYKSRKITLKKLKAKKNYYIRARAFTIYKGKKIYGKWSKQKKIKVKNKK